MTLPAWCDDGPVVADARTISALDAGLRSGIGVFETLRAHGTRTLAADRHVTRLVVGARRLAIPVDTAQVTAALAATLALPREVDEVAVRLTVTAGAVADDAWPPAPRDAPRLLITLHPAPALPLPAVGAATVGARRWPADVKSTSYLASVLAQRDAQAAGADVGVLVDGEELLESAEGNLLVLADGTLTTPPDDGRLLPGVTRDLVLEAAEQRSIRIRRSEVRREDLVAADAVLLTSAVSGLRTVHTFDGAHVRGSDRDGDPHPSITVLRAALEAQRG